MPTNSPNLKHAKLLAELQTKTAEQASEAPDRIILNNLKVTGTHLYNATQSLLYRGILEKKKVEVRRWTKHNLGMMRGTLKERYGKEPIDEKVWHSL